MTPWLMYCLGWPAAGVVAMSVVGVVGGSGPKNCGCVVAVVWLAVAGCGCCCCDVVPRTMTPLGFFWALGPIPAIQHDELGRPTLVYWGPLWALGPICQPTNMLSWTGQLALRACISGTETTANGPVVVVLLLILSLLLMGDK